MTTKRTTPENEEQGLKLNEGERTASDTKPSDREVERARDGAELTPQTDPKQNEDLGIPGGYTEAQKEKMRASRDEPPNTPDINPEAELETIKRNTEAAVEGRSVDIGSAPKVSEGSSGGKNEVKDGIPTLEMQTQISNQIDAERRKEQQKAQAEHDAAAKQVKEALNAEQKKQADEAKQAQPRETLPKSEQGQPKDQPKAKAKDDDEDEDDENGKKGRKR
jgi:hypothetical protein